MRRTYEAKRPVGFALEAPTVREIGGRPVLCDRLFEGYVIYGLVDPDEPTRIRYVGRSCNPGGRYASHALGTSGAVRVREWVAALRLAGKLPVMLLLQTLDGGRRLPNTVSAVERLWIQRLREDGAADLNAFVPGISAQCGAETSPSQLSNSRGGT